MGRFTAPGALLVPSDSDLAASVRLYIGSRIGEGFVWAVLTLNEGARREQKSFGLCVLPSAAGSRSAPPTASAPRSRVVIGAILGHRIRCDTDAQRWNEVVSRGVAGSRSWSLCACRPGSPNPAEDAARSPWLARYVTLLSGTYGDSPPFLHASSATRRPCRVRGEQPPRRHDEDGDGPTGRRGRREWEGAQYGERLPRRK